MASKDAEKTQNSSNKLAPKTSAWTSRPGLYVFSVIILVIIVVSFVGGPLLGQIAGPGSSPVFGRYRGEPIELAPGTRFQQALREVDQQMAAQFGGDRQSLQYQYQVYRRAFEQALLHKAVMMETADSGMRVSTDRVTTELASLPRFQENGTFSSTEFERTPQSELLNLRTTIEEGLLYDRYLTDILQGFVYSSAELSFFADQAGLERRFELARFTFDQYPDEEVIAFATDNSELFMNVGLSSITTGPDISFAEELRRQYMQEESSFEELARENSLDRYAQDGGRRGRQYAYELQQDILDPGDVELLVGFDAGEVSPVIDTQQGYAFFRIEQAGSEPDYDDPQTIAELRDYIQEFERGRIEDYALSLAESFASRVRDGEPFESVIADFPANRTETSFFPLNYGEQPFLPGVETIDGEAISNAAYQEAFFEEAFTLDADTVSQPVILDGEVVVLRLIEERERDVDETAELGQIMPFLFQQLQAQEIERTLLDGRYIEDNFDRMFQRLFLGQQ